MGGEKRGWGHSAVHGIETIMIHFNARVIPQLGGAHEINFMGGEFVNARSK